ncbi:lantibiotic dehydratase family protein [Poritiphilus flavus]|uniref:Lantibiotic dehydratase N-terminal domain-containing protein n=1 Tax=Poritiphilus flavus TaxID=2697053 RepID=A0A6L9EEJ4_9FLAO|nr:lantibiotic dehydratase family protein [Poritiphilus flavus]NAS13002.1 hypothetical protein [Poritiphilus flavus]
MSNPYESFPKFLLRAPIFPVSFFKKLTSTDHITSTELKKIWQNPIVREAIFLASRSLTEELDKWVDGKIKNDKKKEKLEYALLKYIARMSSRCTPFGLFAGCAVGEFGHETRIKICKGQKHRRHTRLDMNYAVALSQDIIKSKDIEKKLLFYPNSSIYFIGNELRYIEYKYISNNRHNEVIAVNSSHYLLEVLEKAANGALLEDLAQTLINETISYKESLDFVKSLVENQILVSDLEPSVSGPEFLKQMIDVLSEESDDNLSNLGNELTEIDKNLEKIDVVLGNSPNTYLKLSTDLKKLGTEFELNDLFQTDLMLETRENRISSEIVESVKRSLNFLNIITPTYDTTLGRFQSRFYERYGEREIDLTKALDVELGIGYLNNSKDNDINPLIDDIDFSNKNQEHLAREIKYEKIHSVLQEKVIRSLMNSEYLLNLSEEDFEDFEENWEDLPDTFSVMIELLKVDGEVKIKLSGAGGSSAANLLSRFGYADEDIKNYVHSIVDVETRMNHNKILAEISHLPESRVGNIVMRPVIRKYEIPYLSKSILPPSNQIPIDDLSISINRKGILLKSKKHDMEVIPRLTNAHNYRKNALPVYHFLCDMQTQGMRKRIGLDLGPLADNFAFIPRIVFGDFILQEATWNIKKSEIQNLKNMANSNSLLNKVEEFRKEKNMPQYVMLSERDNELLVNLKNLNSAKMFLNTIKNKNTIKLREFLACDEGVVKGEANREHFANQVLLSFYNSKKLKNG